MQRGTVDRGGHKVNVNHGRRRVSFHPNHRRVAGGALVIGLLTLVAKLFVAGREMAIAWRFGVSGTVDAYQLAVTASTWIPMMLAGVMSAVLVPRLVGLQHGAARRQSFVAELNGTVLIAAAAVSVATWLASPLLAGLLASQRATTLPLTGLMTAQMAPVAAFMIVSGYFYARLQARERFSYSVTEAVPALIIAVSLLASARPTEQLLALATVAGFLVQLLVLGAMTRHSDAPLGSVSWLHRSDEWGTLRGSFALMIAGQLLITTSIPLDQSFASRLGVGSVAILGYASRIVSLISGLGTIVIGRALLPVLSEAAAAGHLDLGRRQSRNWAILLGAAAAMGVVVLWTVAPLVVRLVFERGAFSAAAAARVVTVLRIGLIQLPFYFAGIGLVQWYAATGRFRSILWISAAALVLKVLLNTALTPRYGMSGIMLSTAGMYALTTSLLWVGTQRADKPPVRSEG